jgi:hypothetical protein
VAAARGDVAADDWGGDGVKVVVCSAPSVAKRQIVCRAFSPLFSLNALFPGPVYPSEQETLAGDPAFGLG